MKKFKLTIAVLSAIVLGGAAFGTSAKADSTDAASCCKPGAPCCVTASPCCEK